jgi:agmatine deiminase
MLNKFLRFDKIIYPLWRRQMPALLKPLVEPIFNRAYPVHADKRAPQDPHEMARFMADWAIIPDADLQSLATAIHSIEPPIETADMSKSPSLHDGSPVRIPAQWEKSERILMSWGRIYPGVWQMHAQMAEAISQVAIAEILVPTELWGRAVAVYLESRGPARMENIHFTILPTNDIWIRDYGPIIGLAKDGRHVALNAIYDVLPQYPQEDDNGMVNRWAAHRNIPVQPLNLHTEGGNLWSDGQGTLIMSNQIFSSNPSYDRDRLLEYLHSVIDFEKLIITPRLTLEETGHVDLLVKLASADTALVARADSFSTGEALRKTKRLLERETNAKGQPYRLIELPTPSLYMNWFTYPIRRGYTNALTVNGRVLVPVFGITLDDAVLKAYADAMPDYEIIPIDSRVGINGGGAVHCMTKEVPL